MPTRSGGIDVSEAKRLKAREDESAIMKQMIADPTLDNVVLKDLIGKKWLRSRVCGMPVHIKLSTVR